MKLLTCMSIAGSIPVVICLLMYLIQHADYNYTLGRRLLITGIFFYLMPVQLIKYLIPKDVFPESFPMLHSEYDMVYKHEHSHLKNHDNLVKVLCLLVLCLHWMNPVAYLLLFLYIDTAEIISDRAAVEGCSKERRKDYAILLVNEASTPDKNPVMWKNNLFSNKKKSGKNMKILKRRINYMMKEKKKGLLQRGIMVAVSALTIVTGAGTVLAYEPMQSSDISVEESITFDTPEITSFEFSGEFVSTEDFSESDNIFVTLDGEQIPIYDMTVPHALCTHSMVNGYLKNHTSNGKGGCTVKVYTCQRCEKCGYSANAVYKNTITYAVCPH